MLTLLVGSLPIANRRPAQGLVTSDYSSLPASKTGLIGQRVDFDVIDDRILRNGKTKGSLGRVSDAFGRKGSNLFSANRNRERFALDRNIQVIPLPSCQLVANLFALRLQSFLQLSRQLFCAFSIRKSSHSSSRS